MTYGQHQQRRRDLEVRPIDDGALLYDPVRDSVHYLNATALFVWQNCDGSHAPVDIATAICDEFRDIDRTRIERDVETTISQLAEDYLLTDELIS